MRTTKIQKAVEGVQAAVRPKLQLLAFAGFALCVLLLSGAPE